MEKLWEIFLIFLGISIEFLLNKLTKLIKNCLIETWLSAIDIQDEQKNQVTETVNDIFLDPIEKNHLSETRSHYFDRTHSSEKRKKLIN